MKPTRTNRLRIVGGAWRSRVLTFPDAEGLRPTPDRVRETLFNWLGQDLTGKRCLDCFAGSGALGFEALSRGAAEVVMVERSRSVWRALEDNAKRLDPAMAGLGRLQIVLGDALEFARPSAGRFDVVFLDPPYGSGLIERLLPRLAALLAEGGVVYAESDSPIAPPLPWRVLKSGRAGAVHYQLIDRGGHDQGSLSGDVRSPDAGP